MLLFYFQTLFLQKKVKEKRPLIQIAILLDTSSSMDGLIGQAKAQLWKIVNEMATGKRNGKAPDIQVAIFEYGNDRLSSQEGFIRQVLPLTTDLDKVSEELFALKTYGGYEFCGRVIQEATQQLTWSKSNKDFKAIFIAGNEAFTQGEVDYKKACKEAVSRGIVVNTIFCGPYQTGVNTKWRDGAVLADGSYMNIDQNRKVVHIAAPQDKLIVKLNVEINKTYIAYGRKGQASKARQVKQDMNAKKTSGSSYIQRAIVKSSRNYNNSSWDLVDAKKEGKVKVEDMKKEQLPEVMRKMKPEERKKYIEKLAQKRKKLQKQIQELNIARKKYVAEQRRKMSEKGKETLDSAMIKAIKKQAAKRGFKYKK